MRGFVRQRGAHAAAEAFGLSQAAALKHIQRIKKMAETSLPESPARRKGGKQ